LEIDNENVETNRYTIKKKVENKAIDYQSIVPILAQVLA